MSTATHTQSNTVAGKERQDKERERDRQTAAAVEAIKNLSNAAFYTFAKQTKCISN